MFRTKLATVAGSGIALLGLVVILTARGQVEKGAPGGSGPRAVEPVAPEEVQSESVQSKTQAVAPTRAPDMGEALDRRYQAQIAPGGVARGFISYVGSFELTGSTGLGLYRWLEYPNDRFNPYRFWRSDLISEGRDRVLFGGGGSNVRAAPRPMRAYIYKDIRYPFWLAFSESPNPDGTYNIAFSLDRRLWYWWDDDAKGFELTLAIPSAPFGAPPRIEP